jgi:photosystem II stability/assembly factor-like uncharacterized protein
MRKHLLFLLLLGYSNILCAQTLIPLHSGTKTSLRGLSVVNDAVAWLSGSNGMYAISTDAGRNWKWNQLSSYNKFDFRDIEAFSEQKAVMVNAGTPSVILLTNDGGASWKEVYRNESSEIFLDGMDFWDEKSGIIYGDPINGQMVLLKTSDGGQSWVDISANNQIKLISGEASFAASGTGIRCGKHGKVWIATGGAQSRIFYSADYGKSWEDYACPIIQGKSSTGPFSIAFYRNKGIAVGGDYLQDTSRVNNILLSTDKGQTWTSALIPTFGYRSAVEYLSAKVLVATGPQGTDLSVNGGKSWQKLSDNGYHTVRKAKSGKLVLLSGSNGKIAQIRY